MQTKKSIFKKLWTPMLLCTASLTFLSSCEPLILGECPEPNFGNFLLLKNSTNDNLNYLIYQHNVATIELKGLASKTTILKYYDYHTDPYYALTEADLDSISVKRGDKIVKTWRASEANKEGKQLFNPKNWKHKDMDIYDKMTICGASSSIFEILPEDLNP